MDKRTERLPSYDDATTTSAPRQWMHRRQKRKTFRFIGAAALTYLAYTTLRIANNTEPAVSNLSIAKLQADLNLCSTLKQRPIEPEAHRDHKLTPSCSQCDKEARQAHTCTKRDAVRLATPKKSSCHKK